MSEATWQRSIAPCECDDRRRQRRRIRKNCVLNTIFFTNTRRKKCSTRSASSASEAEDDSHKAAHDRDSRRGANFDALVQRNEFMFERCSLAAETVSLRKFWKSRGCANADIEILVKLGPDLADASTTAMKELGNRLDTLKILFPRIDVCAMVWKNPEVLRRSFKEIARTAIAWREALPDNCTLDDVFASNPGILLLDREEINDVKEGLRVLEREFFLSDDDGTIATTATTTNFALRNVIESEPYLLTSNIKARVENVLTNKHELIAKAREHGSGLGLFYLKKSTSTALFGKLFLQDTSSSSSIDAKRPVVEVEEDEP